jgi:DNA-binding Lrp family transcriptional regulator
MNGSVAPNSFLPGAAVASLGVVGIQTMPLAIVLINAEVGSEDELLRELRKLNNVSEAHAVYGVYDILAKVEAETMKELKEVITSKVRKLKNLRSSLTMMVMEGT